MVCVLDAPPSYLQRAGLLSKAAGASCESTNVWTVSNTQIFKIYSSHVLDTIIMGKRRKQGGGGGGKKGGARDRTTEAPSAAPQGAGLNTVANAGMIFNALSLSPFLLIPFLLLLRFYFCTKYGVYAPKFLRP